MVVRGEEGVCCKGVPFGMEALIFCQFFFTVYSDGSLLEGVFLENICVFAGVPRGRDPFLGLWAVTNNRFLLCCCVMWVGGEERVCSYVVDLGIIPYFFRREIFAYVVLDQLLFPVLLIVVQLWCLVRLRVNR